MTEQELISRIQSLKQIKPRQEWVFLAKNNIFSNSSGNKAIERASYISTFGNMFNINFTRKIAYSMAVLLIVMTVGTFFVIKGILPNNSGIGKSSTASLVAIKDNVEEFKAKSRSLSELAQNNPESITLAAKEVEDVAKELTIAIQNEPQLAKEVALEINNNKTFLYIGRSENLKETSDVLYKTIVEQMIKDLGKTTLTESQKDSLDKVKSLYEEDKYSSALESILLLNSTIYENN